MFPRHSGSDGIGEGKLYDPELAVAGKPTFERGSLDQERWELTQLANIRGLNLKPDDFEIVDGEWAIDGMPPVDWIDALAPEPPEEVA